MANFFGRTLRKKVVKPINVVNQKVSNPVEKSEKPQKNNKVIKKNDDMVSNTQIEDLKAIMDKENDSKKKVKVIKKDKDLYERMDVQVITEDNKLLLKD